MANPAGKFSPRTCARWKASAVGNLVGVAFLCAVGAGCNGVIHDGGGGGPSGTGGGSGAADPNAAGLLPLRRLTAREYLNTARDLLGDTSLGIGDVPTSRTTSATTPFHSASPGRSEASRPGACSPRPRRWPAASRPSFRPFSPAHRRQLRRGRLRESVHHHLWPECLPPPAQRDRGHRSDGDVSDRADHAGAGLQWRDRPADRDMLQSPQFVYHWEMDPGPR